MGGRLVAVLAVVLFALSGFASCAAENTDSNISAQDKAGGRQKRSTKSINALIKSTRPVLPGPYAGLAFGMSRAQAQKAAPLVFGGDLGRIPSAQYAGVVYNEPWFDRKNGKLRSITLQFAEPEKIRFVLIAAWGQPLTIRRRGKTVLLWFNPENRIRASLRPFNSGKMNLDFHPYVPVREFLGNGKEFAFVTKPLIGVPVHRIRKAYPGRFYRNGKSSVALKFPPTEYDFTYGLLDRTVVNVYHANGKTVGLGFNLRFGTLAAAKTTLFNLLKTKFGPPRKYRQRSGRVLWVFDARYPVKVTETRGSWRVQVGRV